MPVELRGAVARADGPGGRDPRMRSPEMRALLGRPGRYRGLGRCRGPRRHRRPRLHRRMLRMAAAPGRAADRARAAARLGSPASDGARTAIRDSRCRPGRARVRAAKAVIAPDAHTPTVPSTTTVQSVTPCNGESRFADIDRTGRAANLVGRCGICHRSTRERSPNRLTAAAAGTHRHEAGSDEPGGDADAERACRLRLL